MDIIYLVLAALLGLEIWTAIYIYRGLKSIESVVYPVLANSIWIRENNNAVVEVLADILAARGVINSDERTLLTSLVRQSRLTLSDLDKAEELLNKRPEELTSEDIKELKRIASALLTWPTRKAVRLAIRLLSYVSQLENNRGVLSADKVEVSYIAETCTIKLQVKRGEAVETLEEADEECVDKRASALRELARKRDVNNARDALSMYALCKTRQDAGCRSLMSKLSPLERKSLDFLLNGQ